MVKKSTTPQKSWWQCIFHGPWAHHDSALNFLSKLFTITIIVIYLSYCSLSPVPWCLPATDHTIISTWQYVWYSCAQFSIWYMVTSSGSFFFIFMQLAGKFGGIIGWQPPLFGLTPPPNQIRWSFVGTVEDLWKGKNLSKERWPKTISCFVVCPPTQFLHLLAWVTFLCRKEELQAPSSANFLYCSWHYSLFFIFDIVRPDSSTECLLFRSINCRNLWE